MNAIFDHIHVFLSLPMMRNACLIDNYRVCVVVFYLCLWCLHKLLAYGTQVCSFGITSTSIYYFSLPIAGLSVH